MNRIEELNFWVSGLEEVLGEDWYPTIDQWKVIRAKIKDLATIKVQTPNDSVLFRNGYIGSGSSTFGPINDR